MIASRRPPRSASSGPTVALVYPIPFMEDLLTPLIAQVLLGPRSRVKDAEV